METIHRLPQPVIAQVHGMATAAGCQLVAACDLAVAAESARFATPGVKIGLFCSTPMVPLSRAIGRKRALDMLLTGRPIDAATALDWGLVNRVVPDDALDAEVDALVDAIARSSPLTVGHRQGGVLLADRARRAPRLRPHQGRDGDERARRRRPGGHVRVPGEAPAGVARDLVAPAANPVMFWRRLVAPGGVLGGGRADRHCPPPASLPGTTMHPPATRPDLRR